MLERTSALLYWSAQSGLNARVGGDASHTRESAAVMRDHLQPSRLRNLIVNQARVEPIDLPSGARRSALLIETARENLVESQDFADWTPGTITVTPGQRDPFGGFTATKLTTPTTGIKVKYPVVFTGDGPKAISIYVRQDTSIEHDVGIYDTTAGVARHQVAIVWSAGIPEAITGAGSGVICEVEEVAFGYWRIGFNAEGIVAANTHEMRFYPGVDGGVGSVYVFGAQAEDGAYPTSYIATDGDVGTRAVDTFYLDKAPEPQAFAAYFRFRFDMHTHVDELAAGVFFNLGYDGSGAHAVLYVFEGDVYFVIDNGIDSPVFVVDAITWEYGDVIDGAFILHPDGEPRLIYSVNGEACVELEGATPPAAGLPAAWEVDRVYFGKYDDNQAATFRPADLRVVKFADLTNVPGTDTPEAVLTELRAFRLTTLGEAA